MTFLEIFRAGRKQKEAEAYNKLLSIVPGAQESSELRELPEFLNENQPLRKQFLAFSDHYGFISGDTTLVRYQLSDLFVAYATHCAEQGNLMRATNCAFFAGIFAKENMAVPAALAEIYFLWEDLIAARYAEKVLTFQIPKMDGLMARVLADPASMAVRQEIKQRMMIIKRECATHPDWRDSYDLKVQCGLTEFL